LEKFRFSVLNEFDFYTVEIRKFVSFFIVRVVIVVFLKNNRGIFFDVLNVERSCTDSVYSHVHSIFLERFSWEDKGKRAGEVVQEDGIWLNERKLDGILIDYLDTFYLKVRLIPIGGGGVVLIGAFQNILKYSKSLIVWILSTKKRKTIFNIVGGKLPSFAIFKAGVVVEHDSFAKFEGIDCVA